MDTLKLYSLPKLDYKNDRGKFVEAFWNIVNWTKVNERLEILLNG